MLEFKAQGIMIVGRGHPDSDEWSGGVACQQLVEAGKLGPVNLTEGGQRRISNAAVFHYKADSKHRQARGLATMTEASQRLGLYDHELAGIHRKAKRSAVLFRRLQVCSPAPMKLSLHSD